MSITQWESLIRNDVYDKFLADKYYVRDHSIRVYKAAKSRKMPASCYLAALLHDVVEDTDYSIDYLRKLYIKCPHIKRALKLVGVLTRAPLEPYMDYVKRVCMEPDARLIKILDIEDNLFSSLTGEYSSESLARRYLKALNYLLEERYGKADQTRG